MVYINKHLPQNFLLVFRALDNHDELLEKHGEYHIGPDHCVIEINPAYDAAEVARAGEELEQMLEYQMLLTSANHIGIRFVE